MTEALVRKSEQESKQLQYMGGISTGTGVAAYEPTDLKAAMDLCQVLCGGGLVPKGLENKPGDVLVLIATGREYGLSWPAALQNLYAVHGRIGAYAEFQRARIMQHPTCEVFELVEASNERAAFRVKKPTMAEAVLVEFTVEDAIAAKLMKRLASGEAVGEKGPDSNWTKYTSDMLVARATTRAKKRYFPYVLTDIASVEELADLPAEKNITPRDEAADAAAQKIAKAAGKGQAAVEPPEADLETIRENITGGMMQKNAEASQAGAEALSEPEAPPAEPAEKIADALRRQILKEVEGAGPAVLHSLEQAGLTNARSILGKGATGLSELPGIGKKKAAALIEFVSALIAETHRAEALAEKDEEAETSEEPAAEPPMFRSADYVRGLMKMAEEHGVTKTQLRERVDALAEKAGLPAGLNPRALPDPQWVALQAWVQSAKQEALPQATPETAAEGATPAEAVETISPARVQMVAKMLDNTYQKMSGDEAEAYQADLAAWCVEQYGSEKIVDMPAALYQQFLGWVTETTMQYR